MKANAPPPSILNLVISKSLTHTARAKHLGWSHAKVNEIVSEKRGVLPGAAFSLADVFGTSAEMWLNLQANYDLWHAKRTHKKKSRLSKVG